MGRGGGSPVEEDGEDALVVGHVDTLQGAGHQTRGGQRRFVRGIQTDRRHPGRRILYWGGGGGWG